MSYSDTYKVAKCCLYDKKSMLKKKKGGGATSYKKKKKGSNTGSCPQVPVHKLSKNSYMSYKKCKPNTDRCNSYK